MTVVTNEPATEDDFYQNINTHPHDAEALTRFSEWLWDKGDDRAKGYEIFGKYSLRPSSDGQWFRIELRIDIQMRHVDPRSDLPEVWMMKARDRFRKYFDCGGTPLPSHRILGLNFAALEFMNLTIGQRQTCVELIEKHHGDVQAQLRLRQYE